MNIKEGIQIIENVNELGSGSCSSTHLAYHRESNTKLAVKLSDHSSSIDLRFKEEVKILKYIRTQLRFMSNRNKRKAKQINDNLAEFKGYDMDKYQNVLVLEYCDTDLQKNLDSKFRMAEKEVRKMTRQLAPCLNFLHKIGVAHRDIKPSNILLKKDGKKSSKTDKFFKNHDESSQILYKFSDFDLSFCDYRENTGNLESTMEMQDTVGSIEYMSPEIASNLLNDDCIDPLEIEMDSYYTEKTDIWSFGVMLYQCLTGERPFTNTESICGPDCEYWNNEESCADCETAVLESICFGQVEYPERLWRDVSFEAKDFVKKCLERNVEKRMSAEEMLDHIFLTDRKQKLNNWNPFGIAIQNIEKNALKKVDSGMFLSPVKKYQKSISLPSMTLASSALETIELLLPKTIQNKQSD